MLCPRKKQIIFITANDLLIHNRKFHGVCHSTGRLILSGRLHTVVADLNEQAADRLDLIIRQMMKAEGVTEAMKAENQMLWVQSMNSIRCRAEEIIKTELIYC